MRLVVMIKKIVVLLMINALIVYLSWQITRIGYEYDLVHKLYPEAVYLSYDFSITMYGERWNRLSDYILITTLIVDITIIFVSLRRKLYTRDIEYQNYFKYLK